MIFGLDPYVHVPPSDAITWNSLPENVSRIFLKLSALTISENFHGIWSLSYPLYIIAVTFIIGYMLVLAILLIHVTTAFCRNCSIEKKKKRYHLHAALSIMAIWPITIITLS